ncbi:MAG: serine/threonine protein kinase [Casimicrobiaceae bacterium]|nr:serine/threonine protein kinase [Casimicrobiaceae bacterium]MDW8311996.1 serine/threonine-protein kinase [Burkholderiales bacterium]
MTSPGCSTASADELGFWRRVNTWLDRLLEQSHEERRAALMELGHRDPTLASTLERMLAQTSHGAPARECGAPRSTSWPGGLSTVLGTERHSAFEALLRAALTDQQSSPCNRRRHAGERCGPWVLVEPLGSGGMGEVWSAERADGLYHQRVAIKFLHEDVASDRFVARFQQERTLLARLNHPNIARLLDAGQHGTTHYIVLEWVAGRPLLEAAKQRFRSLDERLRLIEQIGEALAYAHRQLVVHRDVKPSNVLVTDEGQVKLLDFGVAGWLDDAVAATESPSGPATRVAGRGLTLEYAAPELITGEASGVACDVYSLGAVAFHLLAGRRAHLLPKRSRAALEHAIVHTDPPRVSEAARHPPAVEVPDWIPPVAEIARLRGDLDAIIATALRRDPTDRYGSVELLLADLRRWRARRPIAARRDDLRYRLRLWLRRNAVVVGLATLCFMSLVGGLLATWMQFRIAREEAARAEKTTRYLAELLRSADPDLNGGSALGVADLLDRAARETSTRFADDPAIEFELTHLLATTYRSLSRDADALPLARRAVEIARTHFGPHSLQALHAGRTLAEIQYWNNDFAGARTTLHSVTPALRTLAAADSLAAFELERLEAEVECANFAFEQAHAAFARLSSAPALQRLDEVQRAWTLADLAGREAVCLTRSGNWVAALALLRQHAPAYASPPPAQRKTALYHREWLLTAQALLGDATGVDATARELIERWRELAGERSDRIDQLLHTLASFYMTQGRAAESLELWREMERRVQSKPGADALARLTPSLGRLEAEALFNVVPGEVILSRLAALVEQLLSEAERDSPRFRQHLYRAGLLALTYGQTNLAEQYLRMGRELGRDTAPSSAIRELQLESQLASARGQHRRAAELYARRIASLDERGERVSLRRASLELAYAYRLWLAGERSKSELKALLTRARESAPPQLPAEALFLAQHRWLSALFVDGEGAMAHQQAWRALAERYGRKPDELPRHLTGVFLP